MEEKTIPYIKSNSSIFKLDSSIISASKIRELLDKDISVLYLVSRILSITYQDPNHGNPHRPLDNLVYILFQEEQENQDIRKYSKI